MGKATPADRSTMPECWYDWHNEVTPEVFEQQMPLKADIEVHFKHTEPNPVPMQPAQTEHKINYISYFINPGKVIIYQEVVNFNFMFADRFVSQCRIELMQKVEPGAMDEPDPVKRLSMFSVDLIWHFRLHFI